MTMTLNDLYITLRKRFKQEGVPQPDLEARELVAFAANADKTQTANWAYLYLADKTLAHVEELAERHLAGEPLAYLLGEWDFYGMTFQVTSDVLIPRQDTECLCELAIQYAKQVVNPRVLDLCCGSGCLGIALLKYVEDARATAVDISEAALKITWENALRHDVGGHLMAVRGNALELPSQNLGRFHLLISNPPYITAREMWELDSSVKNYEPELALFGGNDGLDFYRSIASKWSEAMLPGGMLMVECGYQQAAQVAAILEEYGWKNAEIKKDLNEVPRIVMAMAPFDAE